MAIAAAAAATTAAAAASVSLRGGGGSSTSGLGGASLPSPSDNDDGIVVRNPDGSLDYGCKGQVLMMMMPQGGMSMGMSMSMSMHSDGSEVPSSGGYMNQGTVGSGEGRGCMGRSVGMGVGVMGGGGGGLPGGLGDQERLGEMYKSNCSPPPYSPAIY